MPIQSGTHLGPYEIIGAIGAGGMGESAVPMTQSSDVM
jgi:hypothetical protein